MQGALTTTEHSDRPRASVDVSSDFLSLSGGSNSVSTAIRDVHDSVSAGPLTIGTLPAVLRDILASGLIRYSAITRVGDVTVTVLSPVRIVIGTDEPNQINLFLYRVGPHSRLPRLGNASASPLAPRDRGRRCRSIWRGPDASSAHRRPAVASRRIGRLERFLRVLGDSSCSTTEHGMDWAREGV